MHLENFIELSIGVTTAPRPVPTIARTLREIFSSGFEGPVHLFAEPNSFVPDCSGIQLHQNVSKLGLWKNWHQAACKLLSETAAPYILICQDDILLAKGAAKYLQETMKTLPHQSLGFVSLYTPHHNVKGQVVNRGWQAIDLGCNAWGALAYCFTRESLGALLQSRTILFHQGDKSADGIISLAYKRKNRKTWYHIPSLCSHIGGNGNSSVGHYYSPGDTETAAVGYSDSFATHQTINNGGPVQRKNRTVTVCMATIPAREKALNKTMRSLAHQVDQFKIYLNGHQHIPDFLNTFDNVEIIRGDNSLGAKAKTYWLNKVQGYVFTCDDDLLYPPNYISKMRKAIDQYHCLVGASGNSQKVKGASKSYVNNLILHPLQSQVLVDTKADIIGTGTLGYHTEDLTLKHSDFSYPNMVDISLLKIAERDNFKRIVIAHPDRWITRSCTDQGLNELAMVDDSAHTTAVNQIYMPQITVVLINYKRTNNTHQQIEALRKQTARLKILVWNNGPQTFINPDVDWVINSSLNMHGHVLPFLYQMVDTEYICRMDDDLLPRDHQLLSDLLDKAKHLPDDSIAGAYGTILDLNKTYRQADQFGLNQQVAKPTQVDIVKGRFMFFRRKMIGSLTFDASHIHADLVLNFYLAKQRRLHHIIYPDLPNRLQNLDEKYKDNSGAGYSMWNSHYPERERLTKEWLNACER